MPIPVPRETVRSIRLKAINQHLDAAAPEAFSLLAKETNSNSARGSAVSRHLARLSACDTGGFERQKIVTNSLNAVDVFFDPRYFTNPLEAGLL